MRVHDFKTSGYFPFHVMIVGGVMTAIGISMLAGGIYIGGLVVLLIGLLIVTAHYRCRIDFDKKIYQDYVWVLGLRAGKKIPFDEIQYIFIKAGQESQTMGLRAANTTLRKSVYDAYLKFAENEKIHLVTRDSRDRLVRQMQPIAEKLQVDIIDYSMGDPKIIYYSQQSD